jgi:inosine/xanthosine triphosphatase
MKTIIVASRNPVKIQAALSGFLAMFKSEEFQAVPVSVASNVSDQPMTSEETLNGARQRAENTFLAHPEGDYWIGIEGGVEELDDQLTGFAWVVIRSTSLLGRGRTATFFIPNQVADLVRLGKELGEADDLVFGRANSKQENGAVGILTGDVIDRARLYETAVILALIPFKNPSLYA